MREEEGIPELEEERGGGEEGNAVEEKCGVGGCDCGAKGGGGVVEHLVKGGGVDVVKGMEGGNVRESEKGLTVIDQSLEVEGRELLNALKDIEDHFIRAYDSGKDVSKMLEANKMHMQSGLEEIKGDCFCYYTFQVYVIELFGLYEYVCNELQHYYLDYSSRISLLISLESMVD